MSAALMTDREHGRHLDESWDLILRISALLVVLQGLSSSVASTLVLIPGILIAVSARYVRSRAAWWSLVMIMAAGNLWRWFDVPNHGWLTLLWSLTCAIGVSSEETGRVLKANARTMLALVFIVSAVQKLLFGAWHDGLFLELYAGRHPWTAGLFGVSEAGFAQLQAASTLIRTGLIDEAAFSLGGSGGAGAGLVLVSWFVVLGEVAIGALFVLKPSHRVILWRTSALLAFIWLAYPFAPIKGFAWILLILTLATIPGDRPGLNRACWVSFIWVLMCPYIHDIYDLTRKIPGMF